MKHKVTITREMVERALNTLPEFDGVRVIKKITQTLFVNTLNDIDTIEFPDSFDVEMEIPDQWQPIETAPKDGTVVLVTNGKESSFASWLTEDDIQDLDFEDDDLTEGFYEATDHHKHYDVFYFKFDQPTHWMPLPNPPEVE